MATDPTGRISHTSDFHRGVGWKQPVRCATTANGTLATAYANGQTVDGIVLATGDRILLKDQTAGSENGLYTVNASGAPTRAPDMDQDGTTAVPAEEVMGAVVYVIAGTANGGTFWGTTNTTAPTLGTTAITWVQRAAGAAFGTPAIALGTAAAAGAAATTIRSDATILAFDATTPVTQAYSDAAATGTATVAARRDHRHGMPGAGAGLADQGVFTYLDGTVAAAPATPAAGKLRLYAKTGKVLAVKDDAGVETVLGAAGGLSVTTKGDLQGYSTVAARIPVGADAQVLTADSTQALGLKWAAASAGAVTRLADTLLAADAANITITGISGAYRDLIVVFKARQTGAGDVDFLNMRVGNGAIDSAANYAYVRTYSGTAGGADNLAGATTARIGTVTGAGSTANCFVSGQLEIIDYAITTHRRNWTGQSIQNAVGYYMNLFAGNWTNTAAAIDQIQLYPQTGNLLTGSRLTIYGRG